RAGDGDGERQERASIATLAIRHGASGLRSRKSAEGVSRNRLHRRRWGAMPKSGCEAQNEVQSEAQNEVVSGSASALSASIPTAGAHRLSKHPAGEGRADRVADLREALGARSLPRVVVAEALEHRSLLDGDPHRPLALAVDGRPVARPAPRPEDPRIADH